MLRFFLVLLLVVAAVQADNDVSPLEDYWRSVLPNATMPRAIHDLIYPGHRNNRVTIQECVVFYYVSSNISSQHLTPGYLQSKIFFMKDLYPGAQLKGVHLINRTIIGNFFVPRTEADAITFTSKNLPKILEHFSMTSDSKAVKLMEDTLNSCEVPPLKGEKKFCSTSLESLIDGVSSLLGTRDIQAISTIINEPQDEKMVYNVVAPIKKFSEQEKLVLCHPQPSPQAMHYCHTSSLYKVYIVPLVGNNGSMVNAIAVCHHDIKNFKPFILEALKIKSYNEPICHFLSGDQFVWFRNQ
ncbi:BURP domain-containing protein [Rhynchospora pubera]|uniref:BURP domain-containing protein n=1 Tax=Rhynchospora pubera TaxID=906938 RepID=A0AAV8FVU0_9POAL|nr:BURP domain-containing protein [Rhynchospora pubera]